MSIASYAKINLHLEVIGKLPNNYHQVNTVFCSIDLCDFLSLEVTNSSEISFYCSDSSLEGQDNLVYKMAFFLQSQYQITKGVRIQLQKNIPVAAGLGGGSSNAACCLEQLNKLWQLSLSEVDLHKIAAMFGSDVNFFLVGGTALGTNRGELITPLPRLDIKNILLVNPGLKISSKEAYGLVKVPDRETQRHFNPQSWKTSCFNRLESGIREVYPLIGQIICTLNEQGAKPAMMSGSGSTCFGVFSELGNLEYCKKLFDNQGFWTCVARTN